MISNNILFVIIVVRKQLYLDYMDDVITTLQDRRIAFDRQDRNQPEKVPSTNMKKSL